MNRSLLLPLLLITAACGGADAAPRDESVRAIPVRVAKPEFRKDLPPIVLTGTVGAKEEVPLAFKIGGVVTRVAVDAGQAVAEGDVLAELSLTEINAQVAAAREGLAKARRDFARAEKLHVDSVVTLAQLEDARTGLDVAEAQAKAAEFNRQYAVIRAPAGGVVLRRQLEAGQLVGPGARCSSYAPTKGAGAPRRSGGSRRRAPRGRCARGTLVRRLPRGDVHQAPSNGSAWRPRPPPALRGRTLARPAGRRFVSGLIGQAELRPKAGSAMPFIPAEALLEVDGSNAAVFVLATDGQHVERRRVRVAFLDGAFAALAGGLEPTAQVITSGATRLSDGSVVTVSAERAP